MIRLLAFAALLAISACAHDGTPPPTAPDPIMFAPPQRYTPTRKLDANSRAIDDRLSAAQSELLDLKAKLNNLP